MERAVALKKLTKLLGKKLGYRVDAKAPTPEERAVAESQIAAATKERDELKAKRDERYKAILAADAEYQSLHAAHRIAADRVNELFSLIRHYKITVGTNEGLFFLHKAEGDSWEEVIDKLTEKQDA